MRYKISNARDAQGLLKAFNARCEAVVKAAVGEFAGNVIYATPLDTTRLASNWQITMGAPASGEVSGAWMSSGSKGGSIFAGYGTWRSATSNAVKSLQDYRADTTVKIFLTNNVPYAEEVEFYGGTMLKRKNTPRPAMMVRANLGEWSNMVKRALG
jgi:hypothetical protein